MGEDGRGGKDVKLQFLTVKNTSLKSMRDHTAYREETSRRQTSVNLRKSILVNPARVKKEISWPVKIYQERDRETWSTN